MCVAYVAPGTLSVSLSLLNVIIKCFFSVLNSVCVCARSQRFMSKKKQGRNFCLKSHGDGHRQRFYVWLSVAGVALMEPAFLHSYGISFTFTAARKT